MALTRAQKELMSFEAMKKNLLAQGLIDADSKLTTAGHDWTRDLIKRMNAETLANEQKLMSEWHRWHKEKEDEENREYHQAA